MAITFSCRPYDPGTPPDPHDDPSLDGLDEGLAQPCMGYGPGTRDKCGRDGDCAHHACIMDCYFPDPDRDDDDHQPTGRGRW